MMMIHRRLLLAFTILCGMAGAYPIAAEIHCSGTPCLDSVGGSFSSPVATDPVDATGVWSWPGAGLANAVQLGETAGCITTEGLTADGSETRLCSGDGNKDGRVDIDTTTAAGLTFTTPFNGGAYDGIAFSPGTYTVFQVNGPNFIKGRQNAYICLTSGNSYDSCQGGIVRGPDANGLGLRVGSTSDGSATGYIQAAQYREPQITTYVTLGTDSGKVFTNAADPDGATITLLNDPPVDPMAIWYDFAVTDAQTFTIQPSAGETLYSGASTCSTLSSNVVGSIAHIVAATGGSGAKWMSQLNGTWVCTP